VDELEEVFKSAHEQVLASIVPKGKKPLIIEEEEKSEELALSVLPYAEEYYQKRDQLPFFKDPKIKISIWNIIKDAIGKDISKITVPVYFNSPMSLL